jgi:hypothetical protein
MLAVAILTISFFSYYTTMILPKAYADNNPISMTEQRTFRDSNGNINIIGVVDNNGKVPVEITLGLNITASKGSSTEATTTTTIKQPTYGRIIYPLTGAPFKFIIGPESLVSSKAYIVNVKQISVPYWNVLRLNYSNMPVGNDRALVGTAKNIGQFDLHNVSIYASVHDRNGLQIDSVKSNTIRLIKPGEEIAFTAKPYPGIKSSVFYYSCAGVDLNAPITTLDIGKGQFIAYNLYGLASISDFKYNNATDSIEFGVKYYSPVGGPLSLKIPQLAERQSVSVMMDGNLYKQASIKMNGKTISIDFFVPPEDHEVQIKGIRGTT